MRTIRILSIGLIMTGMMLFRPDVFAGDTQSRDDITVQMQRIRENVREILRRMEEDPRTESSEISRILQDILFNINNSTIQPKERLTAVHHPDWHKPGFRRHRGRMLEMIRRMERLQLLREKSELPREVMKSENSPGFGPMQDVIKSDFQVNENVGRSPKFEPGIAFDGSGNYIVVWEDQRDIEEKIVAQRYSSSGSTRGDNFIVTDNDGSVPVVAMDGSGNFVVVWYDYDIYDIIGQRFDSNGSAVGDPFQINDDDASSEYYPSIAMNADGEFVVIWQDYRNGNNDLYGQRFGSDGSPQGSNFKINDDSGDANQEGHDLGMDDEGNFVVVWRDNRDGEYKVYFQRYSSNGYAAGSNTLAADTYEYNPGIAVSANGSFYIAWLGRSSDDNIYCQRYNSSGTPLGTPIELFEEQDGGIAPDVVADENGNFVVIWVGDEGDDDERIFFQRFSSSGSPQGDYAKVTETESPYYDMDSAMAPDGTFAVAWVDERNKYNDIYHQLYGAGGVKRGANDRVNDDEGGSIQINPKVVSDAGGNIFMIWTDKRNGWGRYDVYGQRYDKNVNWWGGNFRINDDDGQGSNSYPDIAMDASGNALVVWYDQRDYNSKIYGQRFNSSGNPVGDNFPISVPDISAYYYQHNTAVGMNASGRHVAVWMEYRTDNDHTLYAQRFSSTGQAQGDAIKVAEDQWSSSPMDPDVAVGYDGSFAVTWTGGSSSDRDVYCQVYSSGGTPKAGYFIVNDDASGKGQRETAVTADENGRFCIVWKDYRGEPHYSDIYGQILDNGGNRIGDNFPVTDVSGTYPDDPAVIAGETGFVVVWEDERNDDAGADYNIYGQRFDRDGNAIGGNFRIATKTATADEDQKNPDVAMGTDETTLITVWEDNRMENQHWDIFANVLDISDLALDSVATPEFSPDPGTFTTSVEVSVTCATDSVSIYYTTNGDEPDESDNLYTSPIQIGTTTTLKARAFREGWMPSPVAEGTYTITGTVAIPTFDPAPATYTFAQNVTISCSTEGAGITYTTDGSDPDESSALYSGPLTISTTTTLKARAYKSGWDPSSIAEGTYTITGKVATPVFDPAPGPFTTAQNVTITCATDGASIHYTTDGSEPDESAIVYTGPVSISQSATLKARAYKSGWDSSDIATGDYVIEYQGVTITHSALTGASAGEDLPVEATVRADTTITGVTVHYRQGGDVSFQSSTMDHLGDGLYRGVIPGASVNERGLSYYVAAADAAGNMSTNPALNPDDSPHGVQVTFTSLDCPYQTPAGSYRMISVPVNLDNKNPASILADDLGNHDRSEWRLIMDQGDDYVEYGIGSIPSFGSGNGYWLITKEARDWDVGSGESISTAQNVSLTLESGWNQIGHPFAFSVAWNDVVTTAGNVEPPVGYEGTGNSTSGYQYNQSLMMPWKGYYIKNLESNTVTIEIPPVAAAAAAEKRKNPMDWVLNEDDWVIRITARNGRATDMDNFIGCLSGAEDAWDKHDFSEAPPFGEFVSLSFPHEEWERYPGRYTGDFRSPASEGHFWDFEVQTNVKDSEVVLSFENVDEIPAHFNLSLLDKGLKVSRDIRKGSEIRFFSGSEETVRHFRMIAGTDAFTDAFDEGIGPGPETFRLLQNYPNPFNASTRIQYQLPEASRVDIRIYTSSGKEIRRLLENRNRSAGYHTALWDGSDELGRHVASGIYVCTLRAGKYSRSVKMLMVR